MDEDEDDSDGFEDWKRYLACHCAIYLLVWRIILSEREILPIKGP